MPHQLAYLSRTHRPWPREELLGLLRQSRAGNQRRGITGVLLFRNAGFVQLLEGAPDQVEQLYAVIRADSRHTDVVAIWRAESDVRWFADWSMGFRDLEDDPVDEPGLTDVLRGSVDASAFSHEVLVQLWGLLRETGLGSRPAGGDPRA